MARATWNGATIAESDVFEVVEGNVYFPKDAVDMQYMRPSPHHTICSWKGTASYYHVVVGEEVNENAAWYYPEPKAAAANITNHVAFWHGVAIER